MRHLKKSIRGISFTLIVMLMLIGADFGLKGLSDTVYAAQQSVPQSYKLQTKTDTLELYYEEGSPDFVLKDKRNQYIWKSAVDDTVYDMSKANKKWQSYLKSVLVLNYIDISKRDSAPLKAYSFSDAPNPTMQKVTDGIAVTYDFKNLGISVTMEYVLDGDNFIVRIPADQLVEQQPVEKENSNKVIQTIKYGIISLEVLPFFGAAGNDVDGYLLYPDGPGGLTLYSEVDNRPADVKMASWKLYSDNTVTLDNTNRYRALMPIYGIKNNDNALLAVITKGAEQCGITAYPSGYVVNLNHMNFDMFYRYHYDINMSNISVDGGNQAKMVTRAQQDLIRIDKEIRYFMLADKEANYSTMAAKYRHYLLDNKLIKDCIKDNDTMPLSLNIFMGISEQMMIYEKFIKMTTFNNVVEILEDLKANDVNTINMLLRGWAKGGYYKYPINWPPASQLGGNKGLKTLDSYLHGQNAIQLFLENNFIYANKNNGGFSARKDVVLDAGKIPVTNYNNNWYLLNPTAAKFRNDQFLHQLAKYPNLYAGYEDLGKRIYQDYNKANPSTRWETAKTWQNLLKSAQQYAKKTAVQGANQYVFTNADFIYDIPVDTYGYFITDKEVPFLQMVLSGLVPYSATAGNLSANLKREKLKWIEYGCLPHFELTYEDALKLKNTDYNSLYTSKYSVWKQTVIDTYNEFERSFSEIYSYQMTGHEEIRQGVIKITYSNGYTIYVNYNTTRVKTGNYTIEAESYIVVDKGGNVK